MGTVVFRCVQEGGAQEFNCCLHLHTCVTAGLSEGKGSPGAIFSEVHSAIKERASLLTWVVCVNGNRFLEEHCLQHLKVLLPYVYCCYY